MPHRSGNTLKKVFLGSFLGPFFSLIYINDIVNEIHSNIHFFADNMILYITVNDPLQFSTVLNSDLTKITDWANNCLVFNPKTKSFIVLCKVNRPLHPPLIMNSQNIQEVQNHKNLGLYFSDDLNWHPHINYITKKAWAHNEII